MKINSAVAVNNRAGKGIVHSHDVWELILACGGEGDIIVEGKPYHFKRGTVVCVPPKLVHYNVSDADYSHIALRVDKFVNPFGKNSSVFYDDEERTFETIAEILLRTFYKEEKGRTLMLDSLCMALYGFILGRVGEDEGNSAAKIAENVMISRFSDPEFCVSDMYAQMHYSKAHLRRIFTEYAGMPPAEYLTHLRMEHAKTIIGDNDKISHIALCSGFYDARYFSRVFKKYFGIAPQKYRKSIIEKENKKNT